MPTESNAVSFDELEQDADEGLTALERARAKRARRGAARLALVARGAAHEVARGTPEGGGAPSHVNRSTDPGT